jgi:hypothetical protein
MDKFYKSYNLLLKYNSDLKIKYKDQSRLMKIISKLLFFNKDINTRFTTTLGSNVYFPSFDYVKNDPNSAISTLCHEYKHSIDFKNDKLFVIKYGFPQILGLLFLPLIFFSFWFIIPFIICVLPLPAYFRKEYELEAYKITLFVKYLRLKNKGYSLHEIKEILLQSIDYIDQNFTGPNYYYMWVFGVKKDLIGFCDKLTNNEVDYYEIRKVLEEVNY